MVMAHVYNEDMFEMQEARIQRLLYRDEDLQAIPCMGCTLRGGRQRNPARIPRAALGAMAGAMGDAGPHGVKGSNSTKGRGRAVLLRERARKARERQSQSNSAVSFQDDTSSIASSALSVQLGDDLVDDRSGPESLQLLQSHSSPSPDGPCSDRVGSPSSTGPDVPGPGRSPSPMTTARTTVPQSALEMADDYSELTEKQLHVETNNRIGRKKTKFVKLDVAPYYEEYQSELLVGIPAGSEGSNFGRSGFDKFNLGSEHTPCFVPGYRDQRKPKVNSIVDFPVLPRDARNVKGEINFMNSVPRKSESMKSIASFITNGKDDKDYVQGKVLEMESAVGDEEEGCVVIIENVPERIKRKDLTDLIEPYGAVSKIRMEQAGRTQRAYVSMVDATQAEWIVDILDGSDSLIEAESTAPKLKLRIQT